MASWEARRAAYPLRLAAVAVLAALGTWSVGVAGEEVADSAGDAGKGPRYFVDSGAGNDRAAGTSPAAAWKTLAKVNATRLMPGTVVALKRGATFYGKLIVRSSGTAHSPITFTAYGSGPDPVLDNRGEATWPPNVITLRDRASYVAIEKVVLRNTHVAGVEIGKGSAHNVIRQCEITNTGHGVVVYGPHNLITRNFVHDLHMVRSDPQPDNDYGASAVSLEHSDNEVSYNRFVRCRAPSIDYGFDGGAVEFYGSVSRCAVHHNYAEEVEGFLEVGGTRGEQAHDNVVAYNVAVNCGPFGVFHTVGAFGLDIKRFRVENNSIVSLQGSKPIFWFKATPKPDTVALRNNLVVMGSGSALANHAGFTHDHNLFWRFDGSSRLGLALDATDLRADPELVDLEHGNVHLREHSPAIGRGVALGHARDFEDKPVPAGAAPDLGAYQHGSVVGGGGPGAGRPRSAGGAPGR